MDWNQLTFLESVTNLKIAMKRTVGRTPSTRVARSVTVCLQQGRLFYQSADNAPLEIRPLLLFYGTMAFAKALICARQLVPLATLPHTHGVADISAEGCRVAELRLRASGDGTFQRFNDVMAPLVRLLYFDEESMPQYIQFRAAASSNLDGMELNLKEILSRIPDLSNQYRDTFSEESSVLPIWPSRSDDDHTFWELRIDDPEIYTDRPTLIALMSKLRRRFPILANWRLIKATRAWGNSILTLANVPPPAEEMMDTVLAEGGGWFTAKDNPENATASIRTPIQSGLTPPGGSYGGQVSLIAPVNGASVCEYALHYLGIYLLSTLVRYRPQTWVHAITRTATSESPPDDEVLVIGGGVHGSPCEHHACTSGEVAPPGSLATQTGWR